MSQSDELSKGRENRKVCTRCKSEKPFRDFNKRKKSKDGLRYECRKCQKEVDKTRCSKKIRNRDLKYVYGITLDEYNKLHEYQDGKCLICNTVNKLVVDHCHRNKKVRGLLCHSCNVGLGHFQDNIKILNEAIKYLENHSG